MSGTRIGGAKARDTNRAKYGDNFYQRIGQAGGVKGAADGTIKGFAARTPKQRSDAGRKGGLKSKRGPALQKVAFYEGPMVVKTVKRTLLERLLGKQYAVQAHTDESI